MEQHNMDAKTRLRESILDTCKRNIVCKSELDVNCLIVVTQDNHEILLLNIQETITPDTKGHWKGIRHEEQRRTVQKDNIQTPQLPPQKVDPETTLEAEALGETKASKDVETHCDDTTGDEAGTSELVVYYSTETDVKSIGTEVAKKNRKRTYHPRGKYQCPVCSMTVHRKDNLSRHMKKHTGHMLKCHLCPREFYSTGVLQEHIEVEHKKNPYLCNHCGKEFKYKQHLKEHILTHEGNFRYKCPDCDKKYNNKVSFDYHRSVHENRRNFSCSKCAKSFITKGHLKVHENKCGLQKEVNKYCKQCHVEFITVANFQQHLKHCAAFKPTEIHATQSQLKMNEDQSYSPLKDQRTHRGGENDHVEYQDIPTSTEVKLKSGDVATIAVRQQVTGSSVQTKVDPLASSKLGQSLKQSALIEMQYTDSQQLPDLPDTDNGEHVMEANSAVENIEIPQGEPLLNLALPPDDHGHNYSVLSVSHLCDNN